jgi:membrane protease YdiL (CAAX protease family)
MAAASSSPSLATQAERLGAGGPAEPSPAEDARRRRVLGVLGAYVLVAAASWGLSLLLDRDPLTCEAWLGTSGGAAVLVSLGCGVCIGAVTVAVTRVMVRRTAWARALHSALRPAVQRAGDGWLVAIGVASAVGEELLFRGLLVPILGVVVSAAVFGALHQVRGRARWGWMAWATVMGTLFGATFAATGSLAGPIAAHAIINGANLRFLRDTDPEPRPRALGGLLRRG